MLHHTLEPNMDHATFVGMSEPIRKTHTVLMNDDTMAQEIDRVLEEAVKSRLPVFIYVPTDVVFVPLDATRLETPLNTQIQNSDTKGEDFVVQSVLDLIKSSSNPAILADVLTIRHKGQDLAKKLTELTHFPTYSTPLSKGVIDETSPYYNGLYNGQGERIFVMFRLSRS
jgi:pyruvate decarboxylase